MPIRQKPHRNGRHKTVPRIKQDLPDLSRFGEIGVSGLQQYSGYINEEFHRDLIGDKAIRIYKEMSQNSATVGACLYAVEKIARGVEWRVELEDESNDGQRAKELVETSLQDMSQSWEDTLAEILTMLVYGWSYHELVYKYRNGPQDRPGESSRYNDGLIGWRKLPIRSQDSRGRWEFDDEGGIKGMHQWPLTGEGERFIPIEKSLLFRPNVHKNNPEGRSILRTAYISYYHIKRLQEVEAIGIERHLAGYPVVFLPAEIMSSGRTSNQSSQYTEFKKIVRNIRTDEQQGLVMPQAFNEKGYPLYDFKLLSAAGSPADYTDRAIQRHERNIAMSIMADFLFLGSQNVGSWALGSMKSSLFGTAVDALLDQVDDVFNRHAIPRLLGLNGFRLETLPVLKHSNVDTVDLNTWAAMITSMAGAGARLFPDMDLENFFRKQFGWPEMTEEDYEAREDAQLEEQTRQFEAQQELLNANEDRKRTEAEKPAEKHEPIVVSPNVSVHAPITVEKQTPDVTVENSPAAITVPVEIHEGNTTVQPTQVHNTVEPAQVSVQPPDVKVNVTVPKGNRTYVAETKDGKTIIKAEE